VEWARTVRIDAALDEPAVARIGARLSGRGIRVSAGPPTGFDRTYLLLRGGEGAEPAEIEDLVPEGRPYPEAIIALAIEPVPGDALPPISNALGGAGAPAGIESCEVRGSEAIVEILPGTTPAPLVLALADVEVRRFSGYRRCRLLTALSPDLLARVAADGLGAPEIASDRILESLLGIAHVLE
jgi:hypothetical protein